MGGGAQRGGAASENVLTGPNLSDRNTCFWYLLPPMWASLFSAQIIDIAKLARPPGMMARADGGGK